MGIGPEEIPQSLAEVQIPAELRRTRTAVREEFLLDDTGPQDPQRIIAFGSRTDINRLCSCPTWLADGAFKSVPLLWYQLWVIHGHYKGKVWGMNGNRE